MCEVPIQQDFTQTWWSLHSKKLGSDQPKTLYGTASFCKNTGFFLNTLGAYDPVETPVFFYKNCISTCTIQLF